MSDTMSAYVASQLQKSHLAAENINGRSRIVDAIVQKAGRDGAVELLRGLLLKR